MSFFLVYCILVVQDRRDIPSFPGSPSLPCNPGRPGGPLSPFWPSRLWPGRPSAPSRPEWNNYRSFYNVIIMYKRHYAHCALCTIYNDVFRVKEWRSLEMHHTFSILRNTVEPWYTITQYSINFVQILWMFNFFVFFIFVN